jgi:hypothetical protein
MTIVLAQVERHWTTIPTHNSTISIKIDADAICNSSAQLVNIGRCGGSSY